MSALAGYSDALRQFGDVCQVVEEGLPPSPTPFVLHLCATSSASSGRGAQAGSGEAVFGRTGLCAAPLPRNTLSSSRVGPQVAITLSTCFEEPNLDDASSSSASEPALVVTCTDGFNEVFSSNVTYEELQEMCYSAGPTAACFFRDCIQVSPRCVGKPTSPR
eukprot:RCo051406